MQGSGSGVTAAVEAMPPVEAMKELLRSMGVEEYDQRVLHQLLEYTHGYCTDIFTDAAHYAEHASRPGQLECEDVELSARLKASAHQTAAPQLIEWMARIRNREPLAPPTVPNIQMPNPRLCLVEENWQLELPRPPRPPSPTPRAADAIVPLSKITSRSAAAPRIVPLSKITSQSSAKSALRRL